MAALDVMYAAKATRRIALLGSMNEMGEYSEQAHREVGEYCDPSKLDLIVTLGKDANQYLADAARAKGCEVKTAATPYEAGELIRNQLKDGALILLKGSQNGVFAEEAVKLLLQDKDDAAKLVRQSPYWMKIKQRQFGAH
jgi:UDP-N-acetylmuramoyl-tripeptide--D-alanyl-D-alanine ligase